MELVPESNFRDCTKVEETRLSAVHYFLLEIKKSVLIFFSLLSISFFVLNITYIA